MSLITNKTPQKFVFVQRNTRPQIFGPIRPLRQQIYVLINNYHRGGNFRFFLLPPRWTCYEITAAQNATLFRANPIMSRVSVFPQLKKGESHI
jgi:hypothetical protein